MIALDEIWTDIKKESDFMDTRFDPEYLEFVGDLLQRRGFHETKLHLWSNVKNDRLKYQASTLISVISRLERDEGVRRDKRAGGYILRELAVLKSLK